MEGADGQPREQACLIELLAEQVIYDGRTTRRSITYRPSGVPILADELPESVEGAA